MGVIGDRCNILNEPDIALSEIKQINSKRLKNGKKTTN